MKKRVKRAKKKVKRVVASQKIPKVQGSFKKRISKLLNSVVPLSIPVKVAVITGALYISVLAIITVLISIAGISANDHFLGISVKVLVWAFQIFTVASCATISTNLFLDKPLNDLTNVMSQAEKGDFLIRVPIESDDELGKLSKNFNKMLAHITTLTATKIQAEQDLLFAQRELSLKTKLAEQSKVIEENNRTLEALVRDLSFLYEIGQGVNSTIELEELYRVISDTLQEKLKFDKFAIMVKDETGEILHVKTAFGFTEGEHINDMTFRVGEGVTGEVVQTGELIYVENTTREERFMHYKGENIVEGSFLSIPLKFKKDVLGAINFHRPLPNAFSQEEIRLLGLVANQIALAIENAKLYSKARELSVKDELTGLYNRRHFQTVLQVEWKRAVRFHRSLSLLMVDVDHFKKYNDTFGHLHGDKVLREMAAVLKRNIREIDTVARFGGEEFIVLLPDTDKKGATAVGEKIRKLVETHRFLDLGAGSPTSITISVGIASYPDDVRELDDLIDHADIALYEAKDSGRNLVVCYPQITMPTNIEAIRNIKRPNLN